MKMKKLTPKQKEERKFQDKIDKAMTDIKKLTKKHGHDVLKKASFIYFRSLSEKSKALEEIKKRESELSTLKKKYKI